MAASVRPAATVALVLLTALAGSCTQERGQPLSAPSPIDAGPGVLRIEGARQIAPNTAAALTAWLRRPGIPDENVTGRVEWRSTEPAVATVDPGGVVSALTIGEAVIHAVLGEQIIGHGIRAVPDGTYDLRGTVLPFGPLLRARVEVSGGFGPPQATETSDVGTYRLLGVGGPVRITVRMTGFLTRTVQLDVTADTQHTFDLTPDGPKSPWRLTITPAPICGSDSAIAAGTLTADVSLMVMDAVVVLLPAEQPGQIFRGLLRSGAVTLLLASAHDGFDYYPPGLLVRSASGSSFEAQGTLHATLNGGEYAGRLEGFIVTVPPSAMGACYAEGHVATLRER